MQLNSAQLLLKASQSSSGHWGRCQEFIAGATVRINVSERDRDRGRGWKVFRQKACRRHCSTLTGHSVHTSLASSVPSLLYFCFVVSLLNGNAFAFLLYWIGSFCLLFPLFVSFSLSPSALRLIPAEWTVSRDSRSRCDDPYLTFCLFLLIYRSLIPFSVCFFFYFFLSVAHFPLSVLQSVPPLSLFHMCLSLFFSPLAPRSILTCPRYPQILCVFAPCASEIVYSRIHACSWLCFSVCIPSCVCAFVCLCACLYVVFLGVCLQQPQWTGSLKMIKYYRCRTGFGVEL